MAVGKKNQKKSSNTYDYLAYISIFFIVISALYLSFKLTGNAITTSTGIVNVTISNLTAINFSTNFLNLGTGAVDTGFQSASVDSDGNVVNSTGWSIIPANLTLQNIGNVNVSLQLSFGKTATQYLGGLNPGYKYKIRSNTGSCLNATPIDTWNDTTTTNSTVCNNLLSANGNNSMNLSIKVIIPSNSLTGEQTDTITATGTGI